MNKLFSSNFRASAQTLPDGSVIDNNMANREKLKKLKVGILKQMCLNNDIPIAGKLKSDLVSSLITLQTPSDALVPVKNQTTNEALMPTCRSSDTSMPDVLPPFHKVDYMSVPIQDLPKPSFSSIYNYMIVRSRENDTGVENFKGLDRAVQHFDAGDIQDISISQIDSKTMYVRARCLASMKKQKYELYVCITNNEDDCNIEYGFCQCPIGLAQSCSHIGALLILLNRKERILPQQEQAESSCTSQLCQWVVPRKEKGEPKPVSQFNLAKPSVEGKYMKARIDFDPRHSSQRSTSDQYKMENLKTLRKISPDAGILTLWENVPEDAPEPMAEEEVTTFKDPMIARMENMIFTPHNVPPAFIDSDIQAYIEQHTRGQRECSVWRDLHKGRLTSSMFGSVLKAGNHPESLIKQIMEGSDLERYNKLPAQVQWGIDHESQARSDYLLLKNQFGTVRVEQTGITLCSTFAYLGATSDGRVYDEDGSVGILEIKCPYSLKGQIIKDMEIDDIMMIADSSFCLENGTEGPSLKHNHPYYAQVQGEMSVMGLPWCDFVLWTGASKNNIFVERICFDQEFVEHMLSKLSSFFFNHIYPKLMQHDIN